MFKDLVALIRSIYKTNEFIPLHEPCFKGNEKKYLLETIESTFVSSIGELVNKFENSIINFTGAKYAVAFINGTSALHIALKISGVTTNTEVITQSLTFVGTCNAIKYCGANPVFIDVDKNTLGMSEISLKNFLNEFCEIRNDGFCWNKKSNKKIVACLPMHSFGFPANTKKIKKICDTYNIDLIEDAAESLGSFRQKYHTGTFGETGVLSFNGNKIITTGSGGMIITNSTTKASLARHLSTTAKINHPWEFVHDKVGYNYRLSNINAALGLAQIEQLDKFVQIKRKIAKIYQDWGQKNGVNFFVEPRNTHSNYWLNTIVAENKKLKNEILSNVNKMQVMVRPAWTPMHKLDIYKIYQKDSLENTEYLYDRIVNVPSSLPKQNNNLNILI